MDYLRSIQLGAAAITLINVANLQASFTEDGHTVEIPMQCVLIQLAGSNTLVDASLYELPPDSPYAIPGYQPPPGLLARLVEISVQPDQIDHVIITHAHFDHINGLTEPGDNGYMPCFPNARYYLGRGDWDSPDTQHEFEDAYSLASRTLAVLHRKGLLELVAAKRDLNDSIQIIPAPGESPGHQIVRVHSQGETLYCLGDLYHDAHEVEHPESMAYWTDTSAMLDSRTTLANSALAENALLTATHIPGFGRLEPTTSGVVWRAV